MLDIDPELLTFTGESCPARMAEARSYIASSLRTMAQSAGNQCLQPGQRVKHSIFGTGRILEVDRDRSAYLVQFDEMPTPRNISFRARLEPC